MRDRDAYRNDPGNWSDAFKRIPLESPERDIWSQLAAEIRPPVRPTTRKFRWAVAAAVTALAIALPLAWLDRNPAPETPQLATQAPTPLVMPEHVNTPPVNAVVNPPSSDARETLPTGTKPVHVVGIVASDANPPPTTQVAVIAPDHAGTATEPVPVEDVAASEQESLPTLYAESVQLETLLAQMQDDRVSSGPAAALASQYESQLAKIDASLSDPALPDDLRATLWGERVGVLRELAGFKATQRWLNARGERYDGQLVAVY